MDIIALFCEIDDFLSAFEKWMKAKAPSASNRPKKRHRKHRMHTSEVMTILVYFHHCWFFDYSLIISSVPSSFKLQFIRI